MSRTVVFLVLVAALHCSQGQETIQQTLLITIHRGTNLHNTETFGTMDPFVEVTMKGPKGADEKNHLYTRTINNGGTNPVWEEKMSLPYHGQKQIVFKVYDEEHLAMIRSSDFVGQAKYDLQDLAAAPGQQKTLNLQLWRRKIFHAGLLSVTMEIV